MTGDTYPMPKHGWTCFHCGETFTTPGRAREHFGATPEATPGCQIKVGAERGLLQALRKAEADAAEAWSVIATESWESAKALARQASRHQQQLLDAEEAGYERGLHDARKQCPASP